MPRISTYVKDGNITIKDKLLGSSYEGEGISGPIFETRNFRIEDLVGFLSTNVLQNNIIYNFEEVYGDITQNQDEINQIKTDIDQLQIDLEARIAADLAALQAQTDQAITLLDTTLSDAIFDLGDTITQGVADLNAKILAGDTDLAEDIVALEQTITTESQNLTTLINSEIETVVDTIEITNQDLLQAQQDLITLNGNIADALQEAIDAGTLATAAQAAVTAEAIARADADGAIAGRVETVETQFTFSTEDGSIIGASGALNQTINTAASTAAGAVATRVDILETEYVIDTEAGTIVGLAENSITNAAITTVTGSVSTRVDEIETQFTITDGNIVGFSESAQTRIDTSISNATSAQFQTLAAIETQFIFTNGNITSVANVLETQITDRISTATSAQFAKVDEIATQFVFDGDNISGVQGAVASTIDSSRQEAIATADTAAQGKVDTFAAKIVTTDPQGNITGITDAIQTQVSNVVATDTQALSTTVQGVEAAINDGTTGLEATRSLAQQGFDASAEANGFAESRYFVSAQANGIITGMEIKSASSSEAGTPISEIIFNTSDFVIQNGSGLTQLSINGVGDAVFAGDISAAKGTFTGGVSGTGYSLNNSGLNLTNSGSIIQIGTTSGVTINNSGISGNNFSLTSAGLTATNGTFTGTFTAGNVDIRSSVITVESPGSLVFKNSSTERTAVVSSSSGTLNIDADQYVRITSPIGTISTGQTGLAINASTTFFQSAQDYLIDLSGGSGGGYFVTSTIGGGFGFQNFETGTIIADSVTCTSNTQFRIQSGGTALIIRPEGVTINGNPIQTGGSLNYYLTGITKSGNTLTFEVAGTSDVSYTFGANAFTSDALTLTQFQQYEAYYITSTDTDRWDAAWGWGNHASVGYITASALTNYVTDSELTSALSNYALANSVPTSSQVTQWNAAYNFSVFGGTVSGNIYANDFILNSDISLKENVADYEVKPINIQYKEYSFIGTQDKRVGVVAQELEVDHPEFVRESGLGKKSVSYIDLLLAKVAELEARIKTLEDGSTT